jgi:hypothetical protein
LRVLEIGLGVVLVWGFLPACAGDAEDGGQSISATSAPTAPAATSATAAAGLTIAPLGMVYVNDISHDATWVIGNEPREPGANEPKPLVLMDRATGEQWVLCDWADPDLGFCSMAEQGAMIPETPNLVVEQVDTSVVGWFPSGGVYVVDAASGARTRIDTDSSGAALEPSWEAGDCEGGCDYHWAPHLNVSADSVSGDGRIAAFCANYEKPKEPVLYVKDLTTGELTRTTVLCGVNRFGRESDNDEWSDEGMSYPQISADGSVVHVNGNRSTGGEYGKVGWEADTLYFPMTGETRSVEGSGGMTRDGGTVFIRRGVQAEVPEADVVPEYGSYAVATGQVTPLPWMQEFVSTPAMPNYPFDTFRQASSDGRWVVNHGSIRDVRSGAESDIGALLEENGYEPSTDEGTLRISGDGSVVIANVVGPDPLAESSSRVVAVSGWDSD